MGAYRLRRFRGGNAGRAGVLLLGLRDPLAPRTPKICCVASCAACAFRGSCRKKPPARRTERTCVSLPSRRATMCRAERFFRLDQRISHTV
jgi:hypothetical protein